MHRLARQPRWSFEAAALPPVSALMEASLVRYLSVGAEVAVVRSCEPADPTMLPRRVMPTPTVVYSAARYG